jgi:hypothetical protein
MQGLITEERENIDPDARPFAKKVKEINRQGLREGASLAEVVCEIFTYFHYVYPVRCHYACYIKEIASFFWCIFSVLGN